MNDSIYEGQEMFECKFSSPEIYREARDAVIEELFRRRRRRWDRCTDWSR